MNKKITTLIAIIVFICLIFGSYFLYNKLSEGETPNQIQNFESSDVSKPDEEEESSEDTNDDTNQDTNDDTNQDTSSKDNPAPDFTVYDINNNAVKLSDFIGKPIVLNFWASWCGPCKSEMPHFDECYKEMGSEINFLMINLTDGYYGETVARASSYIKSENYSFPVFYDTTSEAAITYQVYSIPTTYFIDADGNLVAQASGAIDKETLLHCIDMIK